MSEEYRKFEAADYVKTEEDAQELLRAATDEDQGDGAVIRAALMHVARTQNMSALTRDTGLNRGNLYEALSEAGTPPGHVAEGRQRLGVEAAPRARPEPCPGGATVGRAPGRVERDSSCRSRA